MDKKGKLGKLGGILFALSFSPYFLFLLYCVDKGLTQGFRDMGGIDAIVGLFYFKGVFPVFMPGFAARTGTLPIFFAFWTLLTAQIIFAVKRLRIKRIREVKPKLNVKTVLRAVFRYGRKILFIFSFLPYHICIFYFVHKGFTEGFSFFSSSSYGVGGAFWGFVLNLMLAHVFPEHVITNPYALSNEVLFFHYVLVYLVEALALFHIICVIRSSIRRARLKRLK